MGFFFAVHLRGERVCERALRRVERRAALRRHGVDFIHGNEREEREALLYIRIVHIAPVLIEVVDAGLFRVEPERTLFGLAHLLAFACGEEGCRERVSGLLLLAADEVCAAKDVAPLVVAAHLETAAVFAVEHEKVVALHEHIAHLKEGEPALHALLVAFRAEHLVHGEMHADVAHEIEEVEVPKPFRVVGEDGGVFAFKRNKARHLLLETGGVVVELFPGHHAAHVRFAGRIADSGRAAAEQHNGPVAAALHVRHGHERNIVANVQAVRSGVKADIESDTLLSQKLMKFLGVRRLLDEAALCEYVVCVSHCVSRFLS